MRSLFRFHCGRCGHCVAQCSDTGAQSRVCIRHTAAGTRVHRCRPSCLNSLPQNIDPNILMLIFLPTLAFSTSLNQEPHLLRRNWGQARRLLLVACLPARNIAMPNGLPMCTRTFGSLN